MSDKFQIHAGPVVAPCVHMNGTGKQHLLDALENAYAALDAAYDAIRNCGPNGRDYYVGTVHIEHATRQHMERLGAVHAVKKSIESEMDLIVADKQHEA